MPNIGLVYALSAGADSIRTFDQSASSSSASSMGNDVVTPWPISERSTTTRTLSSAPMRSQALGANAAAAAPRIACRPVAGKWKPKTRPATPAVSRNSRRVRSEEHTSELQSLAYLVCRLLLEKKKNHNHKLTSFVAQSITEQH